MNEAKTEYKQLITDFISDAKAKGTKALSVYGAFGTGKTQYLKDAIREAIENNYIDIVFAVNSGQNIEYFHEFAFFLASSYYNCNYPDDTFNPTELMYNRKVFLDILNDAYTVDKELFEQIKASGRLRSIPTLGSDPFIDDYSSERYSFIKRVDKALLFDPYIISTETFIVDLLNKIFISENQAAIVEKPNAPIRVLICLDNYDDIAGTVNSWLKTSFIPFVLGAKFSEVKFYDLPFFNSEDSISEYLDFKFLLSGREPLETADSFAIDYYELKPFGKPDILKFFKELKVNISDTFDQVTETTQGVPLAMDNLAEAFSILGAGEEATEKTVQVCYQQILRIYTIEQQDWIKCAAFLDDFTFEDLEFLPIISDDRTKAYNFLLNASDLIEHISENKTRIKQVYRHFVRLGLKYESPGVFAHLEKIAKAMAEFKSLMENFEPEERLIIRRLAHFGNFDRLFAIEKLLADQAPIARRLLDKYPGLFVRNKYTYKVEPDAERIINDLEFLSGNNTGHYDNENIKLIWQKYSSEIKDKRDTLMSEINTMDKEGIELEANIKLMKSQLVESSIINNSLTTQLEEKTAKLRMLEQTMKPIYPIASLAFGVVATAMLFLYFSSLMLIVAIAALGFGAYKANMVWFDSNSKKLLNELPGTITDIAAKISANEGKIDNLKFLLDSSEISIKRFEGIKSKYSAEIIELDGILEESFVRE